MKRSFALLALVASVALGQVYPPAVKASQLTPTGTGVATSGPRTLYVDTGGNDSNACTGTGAAACATKQGAINKVPKGLGDFVTITVDAGVDPTGGAIISGFDCNYSTGRDAGIILTGVFAPSTTLASGLATGTLSTAATGTLASWGTATGPDSTGWTNADLIARHACIISGTGAGQCKVIDANDAGTFTIVGQWETTPNNTSVFEIEGAGTSVTGVSGIPQGVGPNDVGVIPGSAQIIVSGNNCPSLNTGAFVTIQKFGFAKTSANTSVLVSGPENVLVRYNSFGGNQGSNDLVAYQGADIRAESNIDSSNLSRSIVLGNNNLAISDYVHANLYGNYFKSSNVIRCTGCGIIDNENHIEASALYLYPGSHGRSTGSHYIATPIGDVASILTMQKGTQNNSGQVQLEVDTDQFTPTSAPAIRSNGSTSLITLSGGASTITSASTGLMAIFGGKIMITTAPTMTTNTNDLQIGNVAYAAYASLGTGITALDDGSSIYTSSTGTAGPRTTNGIFTATNIDGGSLAINGKPAPTMPLLAGQLPHIEICRDAGVTGALTCDFNQAFTQVPVCSCLCIDAVLANACEKTSTSTSNITLKTNSVDVCDVTCMGF